MKWEGKRDLEQVMEEIGRSKPNEESGDTYVVVVEKN